MKMYVKTPTPDVSEVWNAIPEKYVPYIDDIQIAPQYSQYRDKQVITYNVIFKPEAWGKRDPVVGLFYMESIPEMVDAIKEYLDPRLPDIRRAIMDRWHPKRGRQY